MSEKNVLSIEGLSKSFGNNIILNDISLKLNEGDIYGILGLSGTGKSTLVRCISGLEKFEKGTIKFNDSVVKFDKDYHKEVSMIFQNFNLLDQRTVLRNVELPGELVNDKMRKSKALELLKIVGLEDKINQYPSQLSGGQKQRVAIARALMTNPKILLCDEATSALDPDTTNQILDLLAKLNKELGLTIIIISHQMNVIEKICNKVAILSDSRIVEEGDIQDIFLSPKTEIAKKIIYSNHINTPLDDSKYIKLIFNGEIDKPIVANIVQDCNIVVSIIYADSKVVDGRVYGKLIFKLPAKEKDIMNLEKYLEINNIHYEEVDNNEFC